MPNRRIGLVLIDLLMRLPGVKVERLTLDSLFEELGKLKGTEKLRDFEDDLPRSAEDLTINEFREFIAAVEEFVRRTIEHLPSDQKKSEKIIERFLTTRHIILMFNDHDTLKRLARIEPIRVPSSLQDAYTSADQLVRSGQPEHVEHREVPISANLYGSKLISFFIISGEDFPQNPRKVRELRRKLIAHDSDEFALFIEENSTGLAKLPIYMEGEFDPYELVDKPIEIPPMCFTIYDGNAPHYLYAPKTSVAFFVSAASSGTYRKPIAFRWTHDEEVPGASYRLFEEKDKDVEQSQMVRILGNRLRRVRDSLQLSAATVEKLKPGRSITSNIVGKIENEAMGKLHVRLVADFAEAMDIPFEELFSFNPQFGKRGVGNDRRPGVLNINDPSLRGSPAVALAEYIRAEPFAIAPWRVSIPRWNPANRGEGRLQFWQGEADVALLPLSGRLRVFLAPNPLLLVLDLVKNNEVIQPINFPQLRNPLDYRVSLERNDPRACFALNADTIDRLIGRGLLYLDIIDEKYAYHFNTVLPHAIVAEDGTTETLTVAVTTRPDRRLPLRWVLRRPERLPSHHR